MKKYLFILLFIGLCFGKEQTISDGPYIFIEKNKLIEKNIISSKVILKNLKASSYDTLYDAGKSSFNRVKKIAALSDIHGQYDLLIELLLNNKIY